MPPGAGEKAQRLRALVRLLSGESGFNSQQAHGSSPLSVALVPGD